MIYFATVAANGEELLSSEIKEFGGENIKISKSGVTFEGDLSVGYRACFNTRLSSRILLGLYEDDDVRDEEELLESTRKIPWEEFISPSSTIKVTCTAESTSIIRNSKYGALKVKDGIVDRIRDLSGGERPSVDTVNPDITLHVHMYHESVKWYLDFSGENLSMRGYRSSATRAMMKEHLASTLLYHSQWKKSVDENNPGVLLDPFCGSGTIAIEGALIATSTAPGLLRKAPYAFTRLPSYDENIYNKIVEEAKEKRKKALDERDISIYAYDKSGKAIEAAKENARNAGMEDFISFSIKDFTKLDKAPSSSGYIVTDPPYGERLESEGLDELYTKIGGTLLSVFPGWKASIISGDKELLENINIKPDKINSLKNGGIPCLCYHYTIFSEEERERLRIKREQKEEERRNAPLSPLAETLKTKLEDRLKTLRPIMNNEGVKCYRLYDAEIPEYSAYIDYYMDKWVELSEYKAPPTIKEETAKEHLEELIAVTERVLNIKRENIFVKQRSIQKGSDQYRKLSNDSKMVVAEENGVKFFVNFTDYLDSGIFLDHRKVRKMIQEMSKNKRFLNLFCYTGTATLNAIKGGALSTTSVDSSRVYLEWFTQNMKLNNFSTTFSNYLYQDDVFSWLWNTYDKFDLIFCDPPTFSNGKDKKDFDLQRDHEELIRLCTIHLSPGGMLIFSNNYRGFKLSDDIYSKYDTEDITKETIGEDFRDDKKIHQCFIIKNKPIVSKKKIIIKKGK